MTNELYQVTIDEQNVIFSGEFCVRSTSELEPYLNRIEAHLTKGTDVINLRFGELKFVNSSGSFLVSEIINLAKKAKTKVVLWDVTNDMWDSDILAAWKEVWPRTEVHIRH